MIHALHHGCSLFVGSVNVGRNLESVPMNHLGLFGLIDDIHGDGFSFGHPEQWAGRLPVVGRRFDESARRYFQIDLTDS
jgi:hypothetical protein